MSEPRSFGSILSACHPPSSSSSSSDSSPPLPDRRSAIDVRGGWAEVPVMSCALRLIAESGEGEITSLANCESESDSVPETALVARVGFCGSSQQYVNKNRELLLAHMLMGEIRIDMAKTPLTLVGLATLCTDNLRVISWWDGGGTD